jgi:hypothetical protein
MIDETNQTQKIFDDFLTKAELGYRLNLKDIALPEIPKEFLTRAIVDPVNETMC